MNLPAPQLRVLGALIEKEITTPENYPLSVNSLEAACNQRSSRDPVLDLSEEEVRQALHGLEDLGLVTPNRDARVPKYEHRARTVLNLRRDETALLCLLLLRGPQTPGELRSRADRTYSFDDLAAVTATLDRLASRPQTSDTEPHATGPLTAVLPRQPGARESRYMHLLGEPGEVSPAQAASGGSSGSRGSSGGVISDRLAGLEATVASLVETISALSDRVQRIEEKL